MLNEQTNITFKNVEIEELRTLLELKTFKKRQWGFENKVNMKFIIYLQTPDTSRSFSDKVCCHDFNF